MSPGTSSAGEPDTQHRIDEPRSPVGDAKPTTTLSVTNASPDAFTEELKASFSATPSSFTRSSVIANLGDETNTTSMRVG